MWTFDALTTFFRFADFFTRFPPKRTVFSVGFTWKIIFFGKDFDKPLKTCKNLDKFFTLKRKLRVFLQNGTLCFFGKVKKSYLNHASHLKLVQNWMNHICSFGAILSTPVNKFVLPSLYISTFYSSPLNVTKNHWNNFL